MEKNNMVLMYTQAVLDKDVVPDFVLRLGIRHLLSKGLDEEKQKQVQAGDNYKTDFVEMLKNSPIALSTDTANEQHYEVPDDFYQIVLGPQLKYSSGYWPADCDSLADSETEMLELTCRRAALKDGDSILELGCGWGSLTLFMGQKYPNSRITAVSNSSTQRHYIEQQATERELDNITVITADMNDLTVSRQFDRVVSVEMFEHMRNYQQLMRRIASWLKPGGTLFVHLFSHRFFSYTYDADGSGENWMAENFFTDGIMPSDDLLLHFQDDLVIDKHWNISGIHYHKTLEAWLEKHNQHKAEILTLFKGVYGPENALARWVAWKLFFMACSELFAYNDGGEWGVSHYRFIKRA
jgi:cyclopropane-fatty-acyl-phospholipid synthase